MRNLTGCACNSALLIKKGMVPNCKVLLLPSFWKQRGAVVSGTARTTNAVEVWHFGIQTYFRGAHSNMWKVVGSL